MTDAAIGYGAEFAIGDGGDPTETFTKVAEVTSITPPGLSRDFQDATHLESPDQYREYVASLFDTGDVSISLNFVPSDGDTLFAAMHADAGNFQIKFPNGVMMRFTGAFSGYEVGEITPEGRMEASATLKRTTGKPTLHPAAT